MGIAEPHLTILLDSTREISWHKEQRTIGLLQWISYDNEGNTFFLLASYLKSLICNLTASRCRSQSNRYLESLEKNQPLNICHASQELISDTDKEGNNAEKLDSSGNWLHSGWESAMLSQVFITIRYYSTRQRTDNSL